MLRRDTAERRTVGTVVQDLDAVKAEERLITKLAVRMHANRVMERCGNEYRPVVREFQPKKCSESGGMNSLQTSQALDAKAIK